MPALGGGHALLGVDHVVPGEPGPVAGGDGACMFSDASTGELQAVLDAASVTALRGGAAAVLPAETLGRGEAKTCRRRGARHQRARGGLARSSRGGGPVALWGPDTGCGRGRDRASAAPWPASREKEALAADLLVTVTAGGRDGMHEGTLQPGPTCYSWAPTARVAAEVRRPRATFLRRLGAGITPQRSGARSRGGARQKTQGDVTAIGREDAPVARGDGRSFDSTGLAIQNRRRTRSTAPAAPSGGTALPRLDSERPPARSPVRGRLGPLPHLQACATASPTGW